MTQSDTDSDTLDQWIGKQEIVEDRISALPMSCMAATLDRKTGDIFDGHALPPLWHWAYFLKPTAASQLGKDGHAALGEFLPPIDLPRRMWAGGRVEFKSPLRVGELARRQSTIRDISFKQGRSGRLCFVELEHRILVGEQSRIVETHHIVYRDLDRPGQAPVEAPEATEHADWSREVTPDPVLLFRYSAVTFNGHRIHYDLDYCREQEGYPDLLVHGPLTATLLLDLAMRQYPDKTLESYEFRAHSPLFCNATIGLNGRMDGNAASLWASNAQGRLAMKARLVFAD